MIIKRQKSVLIKQKAKIYTKVRCFALKLDLTSTNKERKYNKKFVKNFIFLKINKWKGLQRSGGWKQSKKLISSGGGGVYQVPESTVFISI